MKQSRTRQGPGELAAGVGDAARILYGKLRRVTVTVTSKALWQIAGHMLLDGTRETRDAEVFHGIGLWSRPGSAERAEAFVAFGGDGTGSPMIIATRNEDARKAIAKAINAGAGLKEGETVLMGSASSPILHIKADNTIELRLPGGVAVKLPTLADVQNLRDYVNNQFCAVGGHTHVVSGAATTNVATVASAGGTPPTTAPPAPAGTTVLKAQ